MHRLAIAAVTLIGLTGAAFIAAYLLLFSAATDRAAGLAPASSAFYLNVYLQPSTGQQMNLGGLIGRLPGFADDASLDEKVDQVVQNLLGGTGIDYRAQVKTWLGDQVAIAGWPSEDDPATPTAVVIAEVKDRAAADAAVADLTTEAGSTFAARTYEGVELQVGEGSTYAFIGEMLVIGQTAAGVEAIVDVQGGAEALADRADFRDTMADLAPDHIASVFVDLGAVADATGTGDQLSSVTTAGAALVAEPEGLRLSGSAPLAVDDASPSAGAGFALGSEPSSLVDWMPEDTIAELIVFGLGQALEDAEAAAAATPEGQELTGQLDTFRALAAFGLGIDLDADLLPLLEREVGIAITGFDGTLPSGQILLRPEDPAAAAATLERVVDGLTDTLGASASVESIGDAEITTLSVPDIGDVAFTVTDGIVILGLGTADVAAAIEAHGGGTGLAVTEAYTRTFDVAGERAGNEAFVHIGAVLDLLGIDTSLPDDARDILSQVGTFGFTAPSRNDEIDFHAVLTIDEARPE